MPRRRSSQARNSTGPALSRSWTVPMGQGEVKAYGGFSLACRAGTLPCEPPRPSLVNPTPLPSRVPRRASADDFPFEPHAPPL